MKQKTVKRAVEAWYWIRNNAHEEVGSVYHHSKKDEKGLPVRTHVYFKNYHEVMKVPESLVSEVFAGIVPNRAKFDTRMYALTKKSRLAVGEA